MKKYLILLSLLCFPLVGRAQEAPDSHTMPNLAQAAQEQLTRSLADLTHLREQIASEKLPLAQKLTAREDELVQLRKQQADLVREADAGNLEIAVTKTEIKARQGELEYLGTILDEYARNFETKVNVSELQYVGPGLDTAKQAPTNPTLSQEQKFDAQLAFVNTTIKRAHDLIGGMSFPGVGVDLQGKVVQGKFALIGPVALFAADNGEAGVVVPQTNSTKPLIRPLDDQAMQAGLTALVEKGQGNMPLDPSMGGALKALVQKTSLFYIFEKGGPIMWPLLIASVLALGTVLERLLFLFFEKIRKRPKQLAAFFTAVTRGDYAQALKVSEKSKYCVVRALRYALEHRDESLANALVYAEAKEIKRYQRGIPVLDTIITLAPLLGLLGTITGMMGSFAVVGGDLSSPTAVTGGVAEALIATAFGLGIAITSLIPFNFLNARVEEVRHEISSASTQLELLVPPTQRTSTVTGAVPVAVAAPAPAPAGKE